MKLLQNEKGFTIMELMIVVAIISVAVGMTSYGINIIFSSRVDSFASQYQSDLRFLRDKTISDIHTYELVWDFTGNHYTYEIIDTTDSDTANHFTIKTIQLTNDISVNVFLASDSLNLVDVDGVTIRFDAATGEAVSGAGRYILENTVNGEHITVEIVQHTGRIE